MRRLIPIFWTICAATATAGVTESFPQCIEAFQQEARQRGFSDSLIVALGSVERLERTIELDRSQPEFVQNFATYLSQRVTDYHVERGRELLAEHREFLRGLTQRYGVPAQYLVAFWGLESNFGRNVGKMPVLDTLATLACDHRRSEFFTKELFYALELMDTHGFRVAQMSGSWAGAIGQTQFLPSAYIKFGIDGDGDEQVDLWRSQNDALTSAAYYLQQLGWQRGLIWGEEVRLPDEFPYHVSGIDSPRSVQEWRQLGVLRANGTPLAAKSSKAALLLPSGAEGPKFLVYDNFEVIMQWNRSQFYALAVGHLANRIDGAGELYQAPAKQRPLTTQQIIQLQNALKSLGFDPGEVDGQLGPQTAGAIRSFQKTRDRVADGFADRELLQALGAAL